MSLQFIFGNSGSGKSTYLYESVLEQAALHPKKNFLVLVPEQYTMQTQRELVQRQKAHAIMNVDVLSFARLAYRVFDELGKQKLVILEETGKNLVLRKIAGEKKKDLKVLGGSIHKMGYIGEVKSLISELSQYHVTTEELERFLQTADIGDALFQKLSDVLTLYRGFREYLEGYLAPGVTYVTAEEVLTLLCDVAEESAILRDSVIVFDEFTGFTPVQNLLIRRLLVLAEKIVVSVTIDVREDVYHCRGQQELFAMSKKTVAVLLKIAGELQVSVEEAVLLSGAGEKRYCRAPSLFFMEQNLFRPGGKKWNGKKDEVLIASLKNPRQELSFAAAEIAALVRDKGYTYKDIAVVTGEISLYANYVPEIFNQFEIPFFIDRTTAILYHPLIEFIRAALEVIEYDFSYESVFRFLRCGLCTERISEEIVDRLENYVLAKGIRGRNAWKSKWTFVLSEGRNEEFLLLNAAREEVYGLLAPLYEAFHAPDSSVKGITIALYGLLYRLDVEKKMKKKEAEYEAEGKLTKAKEYGQIYRIVMDLLDKVVALLGEEQLPLREYGDILDAGFDAAKVGVIPPGNDRVTIGDIERTRLSGIKILFFLGVNDGIVPKAGSEGGILSQYERERMAECNLELAPGAREKVFIQKFYLYLNMTKPSDFLYVTFSKVNSEGKALRRSYLIGTLLKLFEGKQIFEAGEDKTDTPVITPKNGISYFLDGLKREGDHGKWNALTKWYLSNEEYREEIMRLLDAACLFHTDEPIGRAAARALYGTTLENSVTRLERFAACAFSHFLSYGLCLKERDLLEFASVDMGNICHDALERFANRIKDSEYTWFDLPTEAEETFAEESMEEAVLCSRSSAAFSEARNGYLLERLKQTIRCTVWALKEQVKRGRFIPSDFEVSFANADSLNAVHFQLNEEEKMRLLGRIDRIDTCEEKDKVYVRVIDYKSGNTSFSLLNLYHGLQLQLVVYLNAAMELTASKYPGKEILPGGIFYYHMKHPMAEGDGTESEAEIKSLILEQLKLNGLVNNEPDIYRAMDKDFTGSSTVIPVALKSDNTLKASSKAVGTDDFKTMTDYVNQKMIETGKRIFKGDISVKPYRLSDRTGCDYCPYHTVCGFDPRFPGFSYQKLETLSEGEEVLARLREKGEEAGR